MSDDKTWWKDMLVQVGTAVLIVVFEVLLDKLKEK